MSSTSPVTVTSWEEGLAAAVWAVSGKAARAAPAAREMKSLGRNVEGGSFMVDLFSGLGPSPDLILPNTFATGPEGWVCVAPGDCGGLQQDKRHRAVCKYWMGGWRTVRAARGAGAGRW